jgi:hypothetical protein
MKFRELYLDTTYIMPFFYLDIDVKGFSRRVYKEIIKSLERIHIKQSIGMLFSERWNGK